VRVLVMRTWPDVPGLSELMSPNISDVRRAGQQTVFAVLRGAVVAMLVPLQKLPPAPRLFSGGPGGSLPSLCRRAAAAADPVPASLPGRARAAQEASEQGSTRRITRALVAGALIVASMSSAALEASAAAFHPPALVLAAEEDVMRPRFYMDQVSDAMPLKTMRGVWRYKEKREGRVCNARLVFEGKDDEPNRGEVRLESVGIASCYDALAPAKAIRGKWLMKPAKFEGRPSAGGGTIGTIQFNARWKLRSQVGLAGQRCGSRKALALHLDSEAPRLWL